MNDILPLFQPEAKLILRQDLNTTRCINHFSEYIRFFFRFTRGTLCHHDLLIPPGGADEALYTTSENSHQTFNQKIAKSK